MARDPEFLREAERMRVTLNFVPGETVGALADEIHKAPRTVIERATRVLRAVDP